MRYYIRILKLCNLMVFALMMSSCIYDDLSDCGDTYKMRYSLKIIPKVAFDDTLALELPGERFVALRNALAKRIAPMFQPTAKSMSLLLHKADGSLHTLSSHSWSGGDTHVMEFYLPKGCYFHTAVAYNVVDSMPATLVGVESLSGMKLAIAAANDTVALHESALFVGHKPVEAGDNQMILRMRNSAVILVLTTSDGTPLGGARAYIKRMAGAWSVADSIPKFDIEPVIQARRMDEGGATAFYTSTFPSRSDIMRNASVPWEIDVLIKHGSSITKNVLAIDEPLGEGELRVIRLSVDDEGRIESDSDVSVSVELGWKPGFDFDMDI